MLKPAPAHCREGDLADLVGAAQGERRGDMTPEEIERFVHRVASRLRLTCKIEFRAKLEDAVAHHAGPSYVCPECAHWNSNELNLKYHMTHAHGGFTYEQIGRSGRADGILFSLRGVMSEMDGLPDLESFFYLTCLTLHEAAHHVADKAKEAHGREWRNAVYALARFGGFLRWKSLARAVVGEQRRIELRQWKFSIRREMTAMRFPG